MSDEMIQRVRAWLESSGRAFELRVGRAFRQGGANRVQQSFVYVDPVTKVSREGDVLAHFNWTGQSETNCSLTVVVECKSGSGNPWVGFYDRSFVPGSALKDWTYFAHGPFVGITQPLDELWVGHPPFDALQVASHLATAMKDSNNPALDAVRQVVSAAEAHREVYVKRQGIEKRGLVLLPVVVTAAPLLTCRLADSGEIELAEVESFIAWGHSPTGRRNRRVFILNESQVPRFAADLAELARRADDFARFGEVT